MDRRNLFPNAHSEGMAERVASVWDLSWPLPVPHRQSFCQCGAAMVLKDWKFHVRATTGSSHPWRCDVRLKCVGCSVVTIHGVVVPKEMKRPKDGWISWREGHDLLERAGYFA
jgi:hypothetical protein